MGSDSKDETRGMQYHKASCRDIVLRELHNLKEKLNSTPFPFCELNCSWLAICRENNGSECILSILIGASKELQGENEEEITSPVQWN